MPELPEGPLPLLPLRNLSLFPGAVLPIDLGRPSSVAAVEAARETQGERANHVLVAVQRDPMTESPALEDLHPIAAVGQITQVLHGLPGRMTVLVVGLARVEIKELAPHREYQLAEFSAVEEHDADPKLSSALAGALKDLARKLESEQEEPEIELKSRRRVLEQMLDERNAGRAADLCASWLDLEHEERAELLGEPEAGARLRKLVEWVSHRIQAGTVKRDIDRSVRDFLSKSEREALLRHKLRAIQSQLEDQEDNDLEKLARRLGEKNLPEDARRVAERELGRLQRMNPQSGEATIARNYLDWILDLPWLPEGEDFGRREAELDLKAARKHLDAEHHGLDRVKARIIEFLAVRKLSARRKGGRRAAPILCLAGPPGVGKTSIARSVAETLDRPFVRISLGGVNDDAAIRGHRRTYVGALPGRLIRALKEAGRCDPVLLLDEIDKLAGGQGRGDPTSAMLEVLDAEQNETFEDHYLGVPFDLSRCLFICTANELGAIPHVLRDRFELIELSGYTLEEKTVIAQRHLLPRERRDNGLDRRAASLGKPPPELPEATLGRLCAEYTRESGVRQLQRRIGALMRDIAMRVAEGAPMPAELGPDELEGILGPPSHREERMAEESRVGVVTGLGWTPTGGRLLFVEATSTAGEGRLRLTGRLGEVMKESGQAALSLVRANPQRFGLEDGPGGHGADDTGGSSSRPEGLMARRDLHIHLPSGAVPKDGPSAGIALATALVSQLAGRPVRRDIAMTGEITLRGQVLPVGGIREKVLAAHRAGIREVILPARNRKDEAEIPEAARADLKLHFVSDFDRVLELALEKSPSPSAGDAPSATAGAA